MNERLRLENLYSYGILDSAEELEFNELVRLASIAFEVPTALVTFVEESRQWFKAKIGMEACETSREDSFCKFTIQSDEILLITDSHEDERVKESALVVGPPYIRFYAGAPLITPEGFRLGSLCVIDYKPRYPTERQLETLKLLAHQVVRQMEMRRLVKRQQENIRRLGQMDQELFTSQRRFAAFMDNSPAIASIKDDQGRMLYVNRRLEEQFGISLTDWYGKKNSEIFPAEIADELDQKERKVLDDDRPLNSIQRYPGDNGEYTYWQACKFPLRDAGGNHLIGGIAVDVSDQYRAEQALRESEELMRDILENASDLIQSVTPDGGFIFVNRAWREKLGYGETETGRMTVLDILPPESREKFSTTLRDVLKGKQVAETDTVFQAKDGRRIPVEGTMSCRMEDGVPVAIRSIFRDVTERREAEKMREDLIAIASHEMRVPLTSIYGSLGLLASGRAGELTGPSARLVDIAHTSSQRLIRLITDFLDLEKIKAGKMQTPVEPVELRNILRSAVAEAQGFAEQFRVKFHLCEAGPAEVPVIGNRDRLIQVIVNLLSNAAKFSPPEGEVDIALQELMFQGSPGVRISVSDHGNGIPEEFRDKLFSQFSQAQSGKGGTGLGLSIAKAIVEAHEGEIWFRTETGIGTTFYFTLPLAPVADSSRDKISV